MATFDDYITRLGANIIECSLLLDNESQRDENFVFVHGKSMILAILSGAENFLCVHHVLRIVSFGRYDIYQIVDVLIEVVKLENLGNFPS